LPGLNFGRRGAWDKTDGQGGAADGVSQRGAPSPDDLARDGHYVEAMHSLLLSALAEVRRRLGEHFADSLTSREILRNAKLPNDGRASLRDLITRVELSYFGTYPAAQQDYLACRQSFELLLRSLPAEIPA